MRAVGRMLPMCKTPHFSMPHWSSLVEFGITRYYALGRIRHVGSQDTDLSCHLPISSFIALCGHNPPMLQTCRETDRQTDRQTDGRTDRRHARSINALCDIAWRAKMLYFLNTGWLINHTRIVEIKFLNDVKYHVNFSSCATIIWIGTVLRPTWYFFNKICFNVVWFLDAFFIFSKHLWEYAKFCRRNGRQKASRV